MPPFPLHVIEYFIIIKKISPLGGSRKSLHYVSLAKKGDRVHLYGYRHGFTLIFFLSLFFLKICLNSDSEMIYNKVILRSLKEKKIFFFVSPK